MPLYERRRQERRQDILKRAARILKKREEQKTLAPTETVQPTKVSPRQAPKRGDG